MSKRWITVLVILSISALITCVTLKLERGLPNDIKAWYDLHQVIMDSYPPKPLDMIQRSERKMFLTLPVEKQRQYIQMFWTVREEGLQEEYKLRLQIAAKWFRGEGIPGHLTDRGRAMLLFGQPNYMEFRDQNGQLYNEGEERWGYAKRGGYRWFQIWIYWHGQGFFQRLIRHYFEYDSRDCWRDIPNDDYEYRQFVDYWRWRMGPTEDGWKIIQEFL